MQSTIPPPRPPITSTSFHKVALFCRSTVCAVVQMLLERFYSAQSLQEFHFARCSVGFELLTCLSSESLLFTAHATLTILWQDGAKQMEGRLCGRMKNFKDGMRFLWEKDTHTHTDKQYTQPTVKIQDACITLTVVYAVIKDVFLFESTLMVTIILFFHLLFYTIA